MSRISWRLQVWHGPPGRGEPWPAELFKQAAALAPEQNVLRSQEST